MRWTPVFALSIALFVCSARAVTPASTQAATPSSSDLLLSIPSPPYALGKPNPPYPQPGSMLVRITSDGAARWEPLVSSGWVPQEIGPHASQLLAVDQQVGTRALYSAASGKLEVVNATYTLAAAMPVTEIDTGAKQVPRAWRSPLLAAGTALAEVRREGDDGQRDLCLWDLAGKKPIRTLWSGARFYSPPSPSGERMLIWQESASDLLAGWRYTVLDLRTGIVADRFAYNMKGGEHLMWAQCTRKELEDTLRAMRTASDAPK
jgi:hypothetical protein